MIFFIQETEVCSIAVESTIYSCSLNYKEAAHKLSNDTHIVSNWFKVNNIVANPGKFQIMFLRSKIDNSKITFAREKKQMKCKREVKSWESPLMKSLLLQGTLLIYAAW